MEKNYSVITKDLKGLSLTEIQIYATLRSYRKKEGYADLTQKQIAHSTGLSQRTVERVIPALINDKRLFSKVDKLKLGGVKKQNLYYFSKCNNYFFVKNAYFKNLTQAKCFVLLLKSLCLNNTNSCKLSIRRIEKLTGMDHKTIAKYITRSMQEKLIDEHLNIIDRNIVPAAFNTEEVHWNNIKDFVYHTIAKFCSSKGINVPFKDDRLLGYITPRYSIINGSLLQDLNKRCVNLPRQISLGYFVKVLTGKKAAIRKACSILVN